MWAKTELSGESGSSGGTGVFFIKFKKRSPRRSGIFGRSRNSVTRATFTYFLLLLTKICHPNLGSKNFACPARELRAKKKVQNNYIKTFIFHYQLQVKIHSYLKSVFHFMKTRSLGLAWKSLMKGSCFHKMKIVQTLF